MSAFGDRLRKTKKVKKKFKEKKKKYVPVPLGIVKKEGEEMRKDEKYRKWLATKPGWLEGFTQVHGNDTRLYDYQIAHLLNKSKFRAENKSRQIGFSFIISGEALAEAHLSDDCSSIFISYNRDEANEKIRAVQMLYESIPLQFRKKRITDNKQSQEFVDMKGHVTRILSTAQRPPRGKGFNVKMYFDEFAFWTWPDKIYTATIPVLSRGDGSLTVGSTPYGSHGKFFDIMTDKKQYSQFSRQNIPWWHCPELCTDIKGMFRRYKEYSTTDRVRFFGTNILRVIFNSMSLDDFQQEYELAFIDENVSYFPPRYINACSYRVEIDDFNFNEIPSGHKKGELIIDNNPGKSAIEIKYPEVNFFLCKDIEELLFKIQEQKIRPGLLAGFDVGRKKDKSELTVIEEIPLTNELNLLVVRLCVQFDREKFEVQKSYLKQLISMIPMEKVAIDSNGIGSNLAEDLHSLFPNIVEQVVIEGQWKDDAAQALKIRLEQQLLAIPDDQDLKRQLISIKKKVTDTGYVRYDAEKNKEHHGDKVWSLALAVKMSSIDIASKIPSSMEVTTVDASRIMVIKTLEKTTEQQKEYSVLPKVFESGEGKLPKNGLLDLPSPISSLLYPERGLK